MKYIVLVQALIFILGCVLMVADYNKIYPHANHLTILGVVCCLLGLSFMHLMSLGAYIVKKIKNEK